ncbi:helix-turn-helix transcriptional regulator [uncultured Campylobacter sp.]|jgi:uncharacterized HTH-type transcriptional regulator in smaI restriction system 5'region|uniref:helix-turn-helix domain-containing protein n=1 Tax=uncultured Campylobacter sp. TaxID=218934 RepID=UPI0028E4E501|nr:helix-turn-helix transcriptional regulator [uncultured Campylobacter sp.]
MDDILRIFASNVRKERQKLGISQEKLAELSGLHRTYIGAVERCEKNITLISAQKIANAFNTSLLKFLER